MLNLNGESYFVGLERRK